MSEIQPVSPSKEAGVGPTARPAAEQVDTLWKASAYGDFEKLREFVQRDPSLVNMPDEQGYHALQWAALNNRVAVTSYLIEHKANVNAADPTGQTALHWAAVRGSLSAAETLLRAGAELTQRDGRGYTVCHVAAQYGQTAFLYHVALRWGADIDSPDTDGRTPLHWAAYKGFADTMRLLVVMDARLALADKEGCTPLHWAAIRGNGEAATILLQAGSASLLAARDITGSVPAQLALDKGHKYLAVHLAEYRIQNDESRLFGKKGKLGWVVATQLCPVIWLLILVLLFLFTTQVVNNPTFPPYDVWLAGWAWVVVLGASSGLVLLYYTTTADPGRIPTGQKNERAARTGSGDRYNHYAALDSPALWAGQWSQLCVTCKIVRPLRAKHCAQTDRCIQLFDHFCPWVGNTIGKGNRHYFLAFLWIEVVAMTVGALVAGVRLHALSASGHWGSARGVPWAILFLVVDLFMDLSVLVLAVTQASQVMRNVTTNELANWHRYKYLRAPDGSFHNPFDRGVKANCAEAIWPDTAPPAPVMLDSGETMSLLKMEQGQLDSSKAM